MPVTTSKIKGVGRGRPDYTITIEASTVPMVRSHQFRVTGALTVPNFYLPPGLLIGAGVNITEDFVGKSLSIYNASVDLGRNVLFEGYFAFVDNRTLEILPGTEAYAPQYRYGKLEWRFSKGIPVIVPHRWLMYTIAFRHFGETVGPFTLSYRIMGIRDKYPGART